MICPILFLGPSAVNIKAADDSHVRPKSIEGKAYIEAGARGDLSEAARIGMQRTFNKFPEITFRKEIPGGEKIPMLAIASGACLEPHINDGDCVVAGITEPKPDQNHLVAFHIKGQPPDFKLIKIFLKCADRGRPVCQCVWRAPTRQDLCPASNQSAVDHFNRGLRYRLLAPCADRYSRGRHQMDR